jgi:hypothetical protein
MFLIFWTSPWLKPQSHQAGLPDPPEFSEELLKKREHERQFLAQLLDGNKVEQYQIPVQIKAELRKYQQDGVNWLAFLAKYQLHGILCDGESSIKGYETQLTNSRLQTWVLGKRFSLYAYLRANTMNVLRGTKQRNLRIRSTCLL